MVDFTVDIEAASRLALHNSGFIFPLMTLDDVESQSGAEKL